MNIVNFFKNTEKHRIYADSTNRFEEYRTTLLLGIDECLVNLFKNVSKKDIKYGS